MLPWNYFNEQDTRKRQIDTLKVFNDNVTEINQNSEYLVEFTAGNKTMAINVVLGPDFPNEPPCIYISPPVSHPWVVEDSNQVAGAPGLINYTVHSDLGRVVQAIIREFQKSLPNISPISNYSVTKSTMFPELNELTTEELSEILESTDLQEKLLENNPELIELDAQTEELMTNIETIAKGNTDKKQLLEDMKTDVIERISSIVQLKMSFDQLYKRHQQYSEMYDPHKIRDMLKDAAVKADEDAECIAEQFLLGNLPVESFVVKFAKKRALGQARRAREERLGHQLVQLDKATT